MNGKIGSMVLVGFMIVGILGAVPPETSDNGIVRSLSQVRFEQDDGVKRLKSSLESGDTRTGPSTYILNSPPNCIVPWHYHTAQEQLIVIRGSVLTEMDGMQPSTFRRIRPQAEQKASRVFLQVRFGVPDGSDLRSDL
jgi:hypothetical protein